MFNKPLIILPFLVLNCFANEPELAKELALGKFLKMANSLTKTEIFLSPRDSLTRSNEDESKEICEQTKITKYHIIINCNTAIFEQIETFKARYVFYRDFLNRGDEPVVSLDYFKIESPQFERSSKFLVQKYISIHPEFVEEDVLIDMGNNKFIVCGDEEEVCSIVTIWTESHDLKKITTLEVTLI